MMKLFTRKRIALFVAVTTTAMAVYADSSIDEILIHRDARDVQKHFFANGKSRQIYYSMNLEYPATALTTTHFTQLKQYGWSKCSGYREGWDSFVDVSQEKGRRRCLFQNISYWSKGETLLTVLMKYESAVTADDRCPDVPDNTRQHVILLEDSHPDTKEWLKITCPGRSDR